MGFDLEVQLTDDHLKKVLSSSGLKSLLEFIWNSVDADAYNVKVEFHRNELGGIETITITDDGSGICFNEVERSFGKLGNSKKLQERVSPKNGRLFHGKSGQGRYKGFTLGNSVIWKTIYRQKETGKLLSFTINGSIHQLTKFSVSEQVEINCGEPGTTVIISSLNDDKTNQFNNLQQVSEKVSLSMAPYLLTYKGIKIGIDGMKVDPNIYIDKVYDTDFKVQLDEGNIASAKLKIIELKSGNHKEMFLCNSEGVAYSECSPLIKGINFSHCSYVMSDLIEELHINNELSIEELNPKYRELLKEVKNLILDYTRKRLSENASNTVKKLKEENVYPYIGEPQNKVEVVERQVFDICAVKIHQLLPEFNKNPRPSKKLTLELLKQALVQNPLSIKKILKEVLNLSPEQQDEFADLLEKTPLSAIINTTKVITDRITFINSLEQILYENPFHKKLKERSQLHKILLGELWIFGEQYDLVGCDDISLKNVLKEHLKILGREELIPTINFNELNNLNDIPDVCLWRQYNFGKPGEFENLVIELKRPSCTISEDEINQIKKYAYAVQEEKYFDKEKTNWTFIILGTKLSSFAKKECNQNGRVFGHVVAQDDLNVYVREWNQVIQEAKGRLQFVKDKLEFSVEDNSEGVTYLKSKYKEIISNLI